jgi:4-oxalocrotonate tautomerase
MPVITIDIAAVSREKKALLVKSLTHDASEITGIPEDKFVVLINELDRDNIGVGGELLSDGK